MAVPGGVLVPTVLYGLGEAAVLLRRLHGEHQPQPGGLKGLHQLRHICPHRVGRPADRGEDRRRRDRTGQDRTEGPEDSHSVTWFLRMPSLMLRAGHLKQTD